MKDLRQTIRDIPDFPQKGVIFRDITTMLQDPSAFRKAIDELSDVLERNEHDVVLGVESRGFIFASTLAYKLGKGGVGYYPRARSVHVDVGEVRYWRG